MSERTVWVKPGVRATSVETEAARRDRIRRRNAAARYRLEGMQRARAGWDRGLIRPWYITMALDARELDGPDVDRSCGVEEPTVDLWEAGEVYPTFEQLVALAELTGMLPWWFVREHEPLDINRSTLRFHIPSWEPTPDPIIRFNTAAIEKTVGHPIGGR